MAKLGSRLIHVSVWHPLGDQKTEVERQLVRDGNLSIRACNGLRVDTRAFNTTSIAGSVVTGHDSKLRSMAAGSTNSIGLPHSR